MEFSQKLLSFFIFSKKIKINEGSEERMKLKRRTSSNLPSKIQTSPLYSRLDDHFLFQLVYGVVMPCFFSVKIYKTSIAYV